MIDKICRTTDVTDIDGFLTAYYRQLRAHLENRLLLGKRQADKHDVVARRPTMVTKGVTKPAFDLESCVLHRLIPTLVKPDSRGRFARAW